jgi:hypothetical protein
MRTNILTPKIWAQRQVDDNLIGDGQEEELWIFEGTGDNKFK